jgi:anti-anti-sigma factor
MNTTYIASTSHAPVLEPAIEPVIEAAGRRLRITPLLDPQGLRIEGDLDITTLPALTQALASMPSVSICIDLSGLTFIDVGGLRALVTTAARLEGEHVLTLRSASAQLRHLLDLTGWHDAPRLRLEAPAGRRL